MSLSLRRGREWSRREPSDMDEARRVGEQPAKPLRVEIVNAAELGKVDKAMRVTRDNTGKLTGAVITPIS